MSIINDLYPPHLIITANVIDNEKQKKKKKKSDSTEVTWLQ